jgi:DsbC/DsbD-like thiol-disulfide interchange protein
LIAEEDSFRTWAPFWVGLHFELDSGWHIYWQNPGDSGEPPRVEWNGTGFIPGTIRWPAPKRLGSGSVVDYGYEGQVLLMAPIHIGAMIIKPVSLTIGATVKYLVCREICIPGKADLTMTVPVAATGSAAHYSQWRGLFEQTRAALPHPAPTSWRITARSQGDNFVLSVSGARRIKSAEFFPLDAEVIENSARQILASSDAGFQLTLRKSDQLSKPVATLRGLLVLDGMRAYEISTPVAPR